MAYPKIPENFRAGIGLLLDVEESSFKELIDALRTSPPFLRPQSLAKSIALSVQSLSEKEILEIVRTAYFIYTLRFALEYSDEDIVDAVSGSASESTDFGSIQEEDKNRLRKRLFILLDVNGVLGVITKALDVISNHEHVYTSSRFLTDVRPIFDTKIENGVAAFVITHSLKIEYRQSGETKSFFVVLDEADINELRDQIDRAKSKAKSIKIKLQPVANLFIDAEEE